MVDLAPVGPTASPFEVVPTGVPGFDEILRGGLPKGQMYLLEGDAGAGKTTLGMQYLLEGVRRGEPTLWLTLSETERQLRSTAESHGWSLNDITIVNLTRLEAGTQADAPYSFFSPAEIELADITKAVMEAAARVNPTRVVFDPFSDVKLLARDPLRYRRQVLQLREFFSARGVTTLLLQERIPDGPTDPAAEGVVQGVFVLSQRAPEFGRSHRRLRVHKLRGVPFRDGYHDFSIERGGVVVYPRLVGVEHALPVDRSEVSSGLTELDHLLGGGVERGSSLLLMGPAGVGKSALSTHFSVSAAARGERVAVFLFDETKRAYLARNDSLRMNATEFIESGRLHLRQVDPGEFAAGEFAYIVRRAVESDGVTLVVIDSLNGYFQGMPGENHLSKHLHELLTYLSYRNAVTLLTLCQHGFTGQGVRSPLEISYLTDAALLLRYFEAQGAVRRAISVMKRRCGPHEKTIREMTVSPPGVHIGQVLSEFHGVLTGQPVYTGQSGELSGNARPAEGGDA